MNIVTSAANANIALIKYWGKRNETLMLPTKSSFSVSVEALKTVTSIRFHDVDALFINGVMTSGQTLIKFINFLAKFKEKFAIKEHFLVESFNNFPTAAGLASSASGVASLVLALNDLCQLKLDKKNLSMLARLGSGSASRSIYNGFVLFNRGVEPDGTDSFAEQIFDVNYWPDFRIIVVVVESKMKKISSSLAMQNTLLSSKSYADWLVRSEYGLQPMINAVKTKDITTVGTLAELDCLDMHQTMWDALPTINYFNEKTWQIINLVRKLRASGIKCYFTIDAGPNVKILTTQEYQETVLKNLRSLNCIEQIIV